ncbi:MAG: hypothetical protein SCJ97_03380 [Bacillota bacterium]|nr:hypothetical protein [Bacillota bacterium]
MYFEISKDLNLPQKEVFIFLRDKDKYMQKEGSPVLVLEQISEGPVGIGTRYREVVQMLPFYRGEILSIITRYEPYEYLEEDFSGAGMKGHLAYQFIDNNGTTELIQRESIFFAFPLNLLNPIIKRIFGQKILERLEEIKVELE